MSQQKILKTLAKAKNGLTAAQIAKAIGINYNTVQRQMRILRNWNEVDWVVGHHKYTKKIYFYYAKGMLQKNAKEKKNDSKLR